MKKERYHQKQRKVTFAVPIFAGLLAACITVNMINHFKDITRKALVQQANIEGFGAFQNLQNNNNFY